jgi:hypothetical protein
MRYIICVIVLVLILVGTIQLDTIQHEQIHEQICKYFNGKPTVHIGFLSGHITCDNHIQEGYWETQSQVEIASYQNTVLLLFIFFIVLFFISIKFLMEDNF